MPAPLTSRRAPARGRLRPGRARRAVAGIGVLLVAGLVSTAIVSPAGATPSPTPSTSLSTTTTTEPTTSSSTTTTVPGGSTTTTIPSTPTTITTAPSTARTGSPSEGPGYGGRADALVVQVVRGGDEQAMGPGELAGPVEHPLEVRVSGRGYRAGSVVKVTVPHTDTVAAVADDRGTFRTLVGVTSATPPTGLVRADGTDPDQRPRLLTAPVPRVVTGFDWRVALLALLAAIVVGLLVGPTVWGRRRRAPFAAVAA